MDVPYEEAKTYADAIFERFVNPHIHHKLLTLSLNVTSKAAERIVPSIVDLCRNKQVLPNYLSFAFAGYLYIMKGEGMTEDGMVYSHRTTSENKEEKYFINDKDNAAFFFDAYRAVDLTDKASVGEFVTKILGREDLWGEDLNYLLDGRFFESVRDHLHKIMTVGMRRALEDIMQ
jgi:tagaturonate reductase